MFTYKKNYKYWNKEGYFTAIGNFRKSCQILIHPLPLSIKIHDDSINTIYTIKINPRTQDIGIECDFAYISNS
jgi:hypothetical protein